MSTGERDGLSLAEQRERIAGFAAHVPAGRCGEPIEVANTALFLASDDASFCTGSEFVADGGILAGLQAQR